MSLFRRSAESGVDEELRDHIERMVEENLDRGMDEKTARADALRRFGDVRRIRAECVREDEMADRAEARRDRAKGWGQDLSYGLRMLRRNPVHTFVIVLTLGFGIGANAVVFSTLSPYFLRGLPFGDADRLVHLFTVNPVAGWDKDRFSLQQYLDVKERARGFEDLAAYYYGTANLSGVEAAEQIQIGRLSANGFEVLGARPVLGRTFEEGEDGRAGANVLVLGWGLWQRRYAGDPSIIGSAIRVDGVPHTVIGVMARDFNFPFGGVKAWTPIREDVTTVTRDWNQLLVFGRLAPGWSADRAGTELSSVWAGLSAEHPDVDGVYSGINVLGMREALNFAYDILRVAFIALTGAVLLVLLITCANITGLGLARAIGRRREVAVRAAIGAPRGRLIRQFLVESGLLALCGGVLGLLFAQAMMRVAGPIFPEDLYAVGEFGVDGLVIGLTAAVTLFAALLIGTAPAVSVTGSDLARVLREDGRSGNAGVRAGRLRSTLVVVELALGLVLVVGAGLMARSLAHVTEVPLGFEPDGVLTMELTAPAASYATAAEYSSYYERVRDAAASVPGAEAVATVAFLPLNHETPRVAFAVPGRPAAGDQLPTAEFNPIAPGYFEAMGIRLLDGRGVETADAQESEAIAVINRTLAERYYPAGEAVGLSLRLSSGDSMRAYRIVGVVGDVRHSSITDPPPPQVYVSLAQSPSRRQFLVTRIAGDPASIAGPVRSAVTAIDPDVSTNRLRPMTEVVAESVGPFAAMSIVLAVFGGFALLLAAIGLYGLIAYSVSQRQAEFGVRMALGAAPRDLVRGIVLDCLRLAGTGIAIGLAVALAAGQLLRSLLFGIGGSDPLTLGVASLVFLGTALLATAAPAFRASRTDPGRSLRPE